MNKKRLYKQSGLLHPRGQKVAADLDKAVHELFLKYGRYHPRDLELVILHAAMINAGRSVLRITPIPKTVKSV